MTSAFTSRAADTTMADISPSLTFSQTPTLNDGRVSDISISAEDVAATQTLSEPLQLQSSLPFSIQPSSILEDADISQPVQPDSITTLGGWNPSVPSMPPSWIPESSVEPSSGLEYSTSSLSTPSLPQDFTPDNVASTNYDLRSNLPNSSTSPQTSPVQPSQNVMSSKVPSSNSVDNLPLRTNSVPSDMGGIPSATSFHVSSSTLSSSAVVPGILPRGTTPYSVDTSENKTSFGDTGSGFPNATILFIIVPVCVVVFLVGAAIIVACVRRRKLMKKPENNQAPDLWVDTRPEIALVPTVGRSIETPTEVVPGFEHGDIVCRVVYPFTPQLEGQMTLVEKELVKILEKADNGWWRGASKSEEKSGWFPGCYVEEVKPGVDIEDGTQSQSKGKSRVSSFMLKKRAQIRRKSATAVSPLEVPADSQTLHLPTSRTFSGLNSAEINKFSEGRLYKALYAYRGSSKGELSIETGDLVRGWERDRNGWMHGRKVDSGQEGWFPTVYVDEVPSDTSSMSGESTLSGPVMYDLLAPNKTRNSDQEWLGIEHRALYPYSGQSEADLTFEAGDTVIIYETLDNGWWLGSRGEDVGWLPGSYLEMKDDDSSKSDISSILSANDDRSRTLDEELSPLPSSRSSTLSESRPKPKPVRKAPPPPKLKPLKVPVRNLGEPVDIQRLSPGQGTTRDNVQPSEDAVSLSQTPSTSMPKRPAPPPPPQRTASRKSPVLDPSQSSTDVSSVASSTSKLKPGEKPIVPKRFAKPKVIRIPKQSSKLENLVANSRPSTRPAPPRPPPPKFPKSSGNPGAKGPSSNSISGIYLKKSDATLLTSPSNSVKVVSASEGDKTAPVSEDATQGKPSTVPEPVYARINQSVKKAFQKPVDENSNNSHVTTASVEESPKILEVHKPEMLDDSVKTDDPEPSQDDNPPPSETLLFPLESGPSFTPPVVPSINPPEDPEEQVQSKQPVPPQIHPVSPPVVPRKSWSASPPREFISETLQSCEGDSAQEGTDSNVQSLNEGDSKSVETDSQSDTSSIPDGKDSDTDKSKPKPEELPTETAPPTNSSFVNETDTPEEQLSHPEDRTQAEESQETPAEPFDSKLSTVKTEVPPITPRVSPPREISPEMFAEEKDPESKSPPDSSYVSQARLEFIQSPDAHEKTSETNPSNTDSSDRQTVSPKPQPPPKPTRVPPPVLPKPKIKPKPSHLISSESTNREANPPFHENGTPDVNKHVDTQKDKDIVEASAETSPVKSDIGVISNDGNCPGENIPVIAEDVKQSPDHLDVPLDNHSDSASLDGSSLISDVTSNTSATYNSSSERSETFSLDNDITDDQKVQGSSDNDPSDLRVSNSVDEIYKQNGSDSVKEDSSNVKSDSESCNGVANVNSENSPEDKQSPLGESEQSFKEQLPSESAPESGSTEPLASNSVETSPSFTQTSESGSDEQSTESPVNGQPDSPGSDENSQVDSKKPLPRPRTTMSPKPERSSSKSPLPPSRPPPPKSPTANSHRLVNQDGTNTAKKKTLRKAIKSHEPQGKGELAFDEGSFIKEMSKAIGRPGWCIGMLADGTTGLYPQSHVEDAASSRQSYA